MHVLNGTKFRPGQHVLKVHARMCAPDAALHKQQLQQRQHTQMTTKTTSTAPKRLLMVLNAGSSSLKFKLYAANAACGSLCAEVTGLVERIGDMESSRMIVKKPLGEWPSHETCTINHGFQVCCLLCSAWQILQRSVPVADAVSLPTHCM